MVPLAVTVAMDATGAEEILLSSRFCLLTLTLAFFAGTIPFSRKFPLRKARKVSTSWVVLIAPRLARTMLEGRRNESVGKEGKREIGKEGKRERGKEGKRERGKEGKREA